MDVFLNEDEHYDEICGYLATISKEDTVKLGVALGLKVTRLEGNDGDMVSDWLKMQDDVMMETGEPTWNSLIEALEKIGQKTIAKIIKEKKQQVQTAESTDDEAKSDCMSTSVIGGSDRTESDISWPKLRKKEKKLDVDRIEYDSSMKDKADHFSAIDRGLHQARLKLKDKEDDIPPKSAPHDQKPYSYLGFYPMKYRKHGVAVIINNKIFKKLKTREGTDCDEANLIETWRYLGYHIVVFKDLKRDTMAQLFLNIDREVLNDVRDVEHDSFVCCILSHGQEDKIFGSDSKCLKHNDILKFLAKSERLRGKPKLLFIQACQGGNPGAEPVIDRLSDVATDDDRISEYSDFYLSCASVAGDRSYRHPATGSWFVSELCQTLCEFSTVMDLDEMQKKVNAQVVKKYTACYEEKKKTDAGGKIP